MRIQKYNLIISGLVSLIAIITAAILDQLSIEFWANVFIGIFSSGTLVLILSLASYRIERRKVLEMLYISINDIIKNFNKYEKSDDPEKTMDTVLELNKYDYSNFNIVLGDVAFIFNHKRKYNYIHENICKKIYLIRDSIKEKSRHFNEYKKSNHGNLKVMEIFINEIDSVLMARIEEIVVNDEGNEVSVGYHYNRITKELSEEISGRFYDLIYREFVNLKHKH